MGKNKAKKGQVLAIPNNGFKKISIIDPTMPSSGVTSKQIQQVNSRLEAITNLIKAAPPGVKHTASRKQTAEHISRHVPAVRSTANMLIPAVAQYLDPLNHPPVRLPDTLSAQTIGTAVCALSSSVTLSWKTTDSSVLTNWSLLPTGNTVLPSNRYRAAFKLRDPIVPLIVTEYGPDSIAGTPSEYLLAIGAQADNDIVTGSAPSIKVGNTPVSVPFFGMVPLVGPSRYSSFTPAGWVNDNTRVIWVDATPTRPAIFSFDTNYLGTGTIEVQSFCWSNQHMPTAGPTASLLSGLDSANISVTNSGYWSITFVTTDPPAIVYVNVVRVSVSTTLWCTHYTHDSMIEGVELFHDVRVLGDAILSSNTTSDFFKNGMVYARQTQSDAPWYSFAQSEEEYTSLNVRELYQGPLAKGLYAMVKPQGTETANPFGLIEVVARNSNTTNPLLGFRPFQCPGVVAILFAPSAPVSTDSTATSMNLHFIRSLEFTTNSQLLAVDIARVHRSEFANILDAISSCPQFFENPLHLAQIREILAKIGSWLWTNRSTLVSVAQVLAKLAV